MDKSVHIQDTEAFVGHGRFIVSNTLCPLGSVSESTLSYTNQQERSLTSASLKMYSNFFTLNLFPFKYNMNTIVLWSYPGSKIPLILQDLRRILTRTSCKSLQETYKIAYKTYYKISCHDVFQDSCQDSYKISKLLCHGASRNTDANNGHFEPEYNYILEHQLHQSEKLGNLVDIMMKVRLQLLAIIGKMIWDWTSVHIYFSGAAIFSNFAQNGRRPKLARSCCRCTQKNGPSKPAVKESIHDANRRPLNWNYAPRFVKIFYCFSRFVHTLKAD